jgi:hypothetical protein
MQLNETTDISQRCELLGFVRYVHADAIEEEFLFCESNFTSDIKGRI